MTVVFILDNSITRFRGNNVSLESLDIISQSQSPPALPRDDKKRLPRPHEKRWGIWEGNGAGRRPVQSASNRGDTSVLSEGFVMNNLDPNTAKYMINARMTADGVVDKPDVVGAVFGQTEGLLGEELDLRDLQKSGRIGRIEVDVTSKGGKSEGTVRMSSSLDRVETAILASALETIERVGPCKATLKITGIEDVRVKRREQVVERAKELLSEMMKQSKSTSTDLADSIKESVQVEEIISYGPDKSPAGPAVKTSDSIIVVEGRSDVLNLLRSGIKNAIAVEGTNVPKTVQELTKLKTSIAFVDGDRGGELILRELFQVADIDYVARAPSAHEVEELSGKQIMKCLRNKVPADQYMEMSGITVNGSDDSGRKQVRSPPKDEEKEHRESRESNGRETRNGRKREEPDRRERFNVSARDKFIKEGEKHKELRAPAEPKEEAVKEEKAAPAEEKETKPRAKKAEPKRSKVLSPEQEKYRDMLLDLSSTKNAKMLDANNEIVSEVAVKGLHDAIKTGPEGVVTIVFDGVVSQRIVDVCSEKNISTIVGTRKGSVSKMPAGITIWTKEDLY